MWWAGWLTAPGLPRTFPVLAWKASHPGNPLVVRKLRLLANLVTQEPMVSTKGNKHTQRETCPRPSEHLWNCFLTRMSLLICRASFCELGPALNDWNNKSNATQAWGWVPYSLPFPLHHSTSNPNERWIDPKSHWFGRNKISSCPSVSISPVPISPWGSNTSLLVPPNPRPQEVTTAHTELLPRLPCPLSCTLTFQFSHLLLEAFLTCPSERTIHHRFCAPVPCQDFHHSFQSLLWPLPLGKDEIILPFSPGPAFLGTQYKCVSQGMRESPSKVTCSLFKLVWDKWVLAQMQGTIGPGCRYNSGAQIAKRECRLLFPCKPSLLVSFSVGL